MNDSVEFTEISFTQTHNIGVISGHGHVEFCQEESFQLANVGWYNFLRAIVISTTGISAVAGNILVLIVLNTRPYNYLFSATTRRFLSSLAVTDLSLAALFVPFCVIPGLLYCWPHGRFFCQIQALLIAALFHHSTLGILEVAVDRFIFITYPLRYEQIMTKTRSIIVIALGWTLPFLLYGILIFAQDQYYFDTTGATCEPHYDNRNIIISVVTIFYFPPLLAMFFIYGVLYRITLKSMNKVAYFSGGSAIDQKQKLKKSNIRACKTLGGITLGFFLTVSPWTITQIIMSVGGINVNEVVDFVTTWIAVSNSFWNVLIYSFTNRSFRRAAKTLIMKVLCCVRREGNFETSSYASASRRNTGDVGMSTGFY